MKQTSDRYWQAIGVPVWRLRDVMPAKLVQAYLLVSQHSDEVVVSVLADSDSEAEQVLLAKIAEALGAKLSSLDLDQLIKFAHTSCIVFGQHLLRQVADFNFKQKIAVCSLQAMLDDSSLKKAVWDELRLFRS